MWRLLDNISSETWPVIMPIRPMLCSESTQYWQQCGYLTKLSAAQICRRTQQFAQEIRTNTHTRRHTHKRTNVQKSSKDVRYKNVLECVAECNVVQCSVH